jgi:S1-C subfamily serine protease
VPGDLLDVVLVVLVAAFAVAGYRQGFIIGVLSLAGFIAGVVGGAYLAPGISRSLAHSQSMQAFLAILVVFAAAVIGMLLASAIGVAVRSKLVGRPATLVDSLGGAVVNVIAVLTVAWLISSLVGNAGQFPGIARQVNQSTVLRAVDAVMPHTFEFLPVFPGLRTMLSNGLSETVFSSIGAEGNPNLRPASSAVLRWPALRRAEPSIVKVTGIAPSCSLKIEGSGFVISPQHVLTNAHVVAGVTDGPTVLTIEGQSLAARVVLYDPDRDIAVLYVPGLTARPLQFAGAAKQGTSAVAAGYPLNRGLTLVPATVGQSETADGTNIYGGAGVARQIYPMEAVIRPGNSGGPLISRNGRVYGVVFAASTYNNDIGYALTASEVASDAQQGSHATVRRSTQACQNG